MSAYGKIYDPQEITLLIKYNDFVDYLIDGKIVIPMNSDKIKEWACDIKTQQVLVDCLMHLFVFKLDGYDAIKFKDSMACNLHFVQEIYKSTLKYVEKIKNRGQ